MSMVSLKYLTVSVQKIINSLASGYRPYTRTNHTVAYCTISTLHIVHLWVSGVEHLKGAITYVNIRTITTIAF